MLSNPTCPVCGNEVVPLLGRGRPREYDTPDCKKRAYYCRINGLPITEAKHQDKRETDEKDLETLIAEQAKDMESGDRVFGEHRVFLEDLRAENAQGDRGWDYWLNPGVNEWSDPVAEMAFEQDL